MARQRSCLIIHGGLCYLNFGPGTQAALYALDVKTGEVVWKVAPPKESGRFPGGPFGGRGPGRGVPRRCPEEGEWGLRVGLQEGRRGRRSSREPA